MSNQTRREQIKRIINETKRPVSRIARAISVENGTLYKYLNHKTETSSKNYFAVLEELRGKGTEQKIIDFIDTL